MVFREFMMTLSDDITPEAAKEASLLRFAAPR